MSRPLLGTTYSHREIEYLSLDQADSLERLLKFHFDIVRICVYWRDIEKSQGIFDYSVIKRILDKCEEAGQKTVVTLGMKSPRWPEFYIPHWLDQRPVKVSEQVLFFIEQTVRELKGSSCISHWQVENEPLDPSGPENLLIQNGLLEKEISLVKSLDKRPVIVTLWGNDLVKRGTVSLIKGYADIVGVDLYYNFPNKQDFSSEDVSEELRTLGKPFWITELQAEPWETDEETRLSLYTPSINPEMLKENFEKVLLLSPKAVLFWGFEYWLWREKQGDAALIEAVKGILDALKG